MNALAENESARQVMGEPALRVIAREASIKNSVTVDWMHRDAGRGGAERQAEALSAVWAA